MRSQHADHVTSSRPIRAKIQVTSQMWEIMHTGTTNINRNIWQMMRLSPYLTLHILSVQKSKSHCQHMSQCYFSHNENLQTIYILTLWLIPSVFAGFCSNSACLFLQNSRYKVGRTYTRQKLHCLNYCQLSVLTLWLAPNSFTFSLIFIVFGKCFFLKRIVSQIE